MTSQQKRTRVKTLLERRALKVREARKRLGQISNPVYDQHYQDFLSRLNRS